MKKNLLTAILFFTSLGALAQQPVIAGDVMLCPESTGTAYVTNDVDFDTYQWHVDFYPYGTFDPVPGATGDSFTYDTYNYTMAKIKVVTTLNGDTSESNVLTIDSMVFLPISYSTVYEGDAYYDANQGAYVLCEGDAIIQTVNNPYNNVQWFNNNQPINGATNQQFTITSPGVYYAVASPQSCPDYEQTTLTINVVACTQDEPVPVIEGDVMLCPHTNGAATVITDLDYDSYQWYADYYPYGEFELIDGATQADFTYDWDTYDQAKLKVVVTLNGETYESNIIQIDSHQWTSMTVSSQVTQQVLWNSETETWLLCEGSGFVQTVNSPYTENIQWYKDGVLIDGATQSTYTITTEGVYTVVASPAVCPQEENSAESTPIVVTMQDCNMGTEPSLANVNFMVYPNPVLNKLNILMPNGTSLSEFTIFDLTGKALLQGKPDTHTPEIDVITLENGIYILQLKGDTIIASLLFSKL
jgi:hypothetical protein